MICDADGPTSLAGIMGGARSEVDERTTRVLLEAANWDGATVQRTAPRLGLRSEASARFEKGLSPEQTLEAQALASALLVELCGARVRARDGRRRRRRRAPPPILLRPRRVARAARQRDRAGALQRDPARSISASRLVARGP